MSKQIYVIEEKIKIADWTGWRYFVAFDSLEEAEKAEEYLNKVLSGETYKMSEVRMESSFDEFKKRFG